MNEAEKAVIGCCLLDEKAILTADRIVSEEMFTHPYLKRIWSEIERCARTQKPIDIVTISSGIDPVEIPKSELHPLLLDCTKNISGWKIEYYAKIVQDNHKARVFDAIRTSFKGDPQKVNNQTVAMISQLEKLADEGEHKTITADKAVEEYADKLFTPDREQGIRTGYKTLDEILGGMYDGEMIIMAARPAVGKSALSTEIALNIAKSGKRVSLFNLEMSNEQLFQRLIAHESGIELGRVRGATALNGENESKQFDAAVESIRSLGEKLNMCDTMWKVTSMASEMRRHKSDIAIIDYAQLIRPESDYKGNRTAEVGQISHSLKMTAKRLHIPIIVLAQLNRASMMTKTKEPSMSELRESGDFEQDADKIILLWNRDDEKKLKGIKVEKNRQGKTGVLNMNFEGAVMQFSEVDEFEDDDEDYSDTPFG